MGAPTALSPIALTMGEPAGISGEITIKAWLARHELNLSPFFVIDDIDRLRHIAQTLGHTVPFCEIETPSQTIEVFASALPVLSCRCALSVKPSEPNPANVPAVRQSIERAVAYVQSKQACALVTNPIHKDVMYQGGFAFAGHTEFLAHLLKESQQEVMMLAIPQLRVVLASIHKSLRLAIKELRSEDIIRVGRISALALRNDFAIAKPRLAVAALNPHAGENGTMGDEEAMIIMPAIKALQNMGIDAKGPFAADTLFHPQARVQYDAVICLYHDQGLIPLKTIDFDHGVNITLGLSIVRTSPDHGTAFDVAGQNLARADSLIEALQIARQISVNRAGLGCAEPEQAQPAL